MVEPEIAFADIQEAVKARKFENKVEWGIDLASEHERYLTKEKSKAPVIVYNYPKAIKACDAKVNEDNKTVAEMECLYLRRLAISMHLTDGLYLNVFRPHSYQGNVYEVATRRNTTAVLEAGASMMIKESRKSLQSDYGGCIRLRHECALALCDFDLSKCGVVEA
ncbi:UNVERIFIED_CONTAM: Asparagine--tRNA ligase [Sesamum calycinum]|uniref:Asparagine--tRNA ligase n=1 Tax=Sesamum calycinum TaxID=2727403 RepID=A0AAW2QK16_9LAMI